MELLYEDGIPLGLHGVVKENFFHTLLIKVAWDVKEDLPKYIFFQAHNSNLLLRQYLSGSYQTIKIWQNPAHAWG